MCNFDPGEAGKVMNRVATNRAIDGADKEVEDDSPEEQACFTSYLDFNQWKITTTMAF
jgi:hypothetical protein